MPLSSSVHDLKTLVLSFHPVLAIETPEEERVRSLVEATANDLRMPFFEWSVTRGLMRPGNDTKIYETQDPRRVLQHLEGLTVEALFLLKDFSAHLDDPAITRQFREVAQRFANTRSTLVLTGNSIQLPPAIETRTVYYTLKLPGREELREVFRHVITSLRQGEGVRIDLEPDDLEELLDALHGMTLNQARQAIAYAALQDGVIARDDVKRILDRKAQAIREGGLLEYFPVADNRFELAGFGRLRGWLDRARIGFTPQARELNLTPPKGILLVGVQGCGKSLAAKVIARDWELPLLKLDAGSLFDKYVGESEKNFRKAVALAESLAPTVLWIDEIEKGLTPGRGGGEADGGLARRLFGFFLTWLQEKRSNVFVVATANDIFVLPPELLRKGRFDEIFFVDLPNDAERRAIFDVHLRLRKQDPTGFDLDALVAATRGFNGAEIEQAVIAGLYRALHAKRDLDTTLVLQEIGETVPLSVSRREDVERLRETAEGRFVPVA